MLLLATRTSESEYRMLDERGRPIGRVIEPRGRRVVGLGEGTVLLVRETRESQPRA